MSLVFGGGGQIFPLLIWIGLKVQAFMYYDVLWYPNVNFIIEYYLLKIFPFKISFISKFELRLQVSNWVSKKIYSLVGNNRKQVRLSRATLELLLFLLDSKYNYSMVSIIHRINFFYQHFLGKKIILGPKKGWAWRNFGAWHAMQLP